MYNTLNVHLYGGPGIGKSTTAAALFVALKRAGFSVELITEYAKELFYAGQLLSTPQTLISTTQYERQRLVQGKVQVAISDSPLPTSLLHCQDAQERENLEMRMRAWLNEWNRLDVLLHRDLAVSYEQSGRYQSQDEAIHFHREVVTPYVEKFVGSALIQMNIEENIEDCVERLFAKIVNTLEAT